MSAAPAGRVQEPPAIHWRGRPRELAQVLRRKRRLRAGSVQLLAIAVAIGLAFLMPQVQIGVEIPTSRVIETLVAAGAGTVAFIGIVFSLLFLVIQFGSTTFSLRLNLFRDQPIVWRTFAFDTGVVAYSLTAVLVIGRDDKTSAAVPIVAFVAILASLILYRQLLLGAFKSIQLASTLAQLAHRGRVVIDGLYVLNAPPTDWVDDPDRAGVPVATEDARHEIRWPRPAAIVQVVDVPRVLRAARRAQVVIQFKVGAGELIAEGATLAVVTGETEPQLERAILKAFNVGEEEPSSRIQRSRFDCWPTSRSEHFRQRSMTQPQQRSRSTPWTACFACSPPANSPSSVSSTATAPSG